MNKLKINVGIASVILLGSLFSGWQTLLLVVALILLFCELNNELKNVIIKVVTFYLGLSIFSLAWDLIVSGINLIPTIINQLISLINNYLTEPISLFKLEAYLIKPILEIVSICDNVVNYLLTFVKFSFIVAILSRNSLKENFVVKKINNYIEKAVNFVNSYEVVQNIQPNNQVVVSNTVQMPQQNVNFNSNIPNVPNNISNQ